MLFGVCVCVGKFDGSIRYAFSVFLLCRKARLKVAAAAAVSHRSFFSETGQFFFSHSKDFYLRIINMMASTGNKKEVNLLRTSEMMMINSEGLSNASVLDRICSVCK